ncbi:MAG: ABC transporter ATP-binding protein [Chloroflexota bacterium]|nr:ABC transporter ATP-binding protein [Chloroflexota bacterium]
MSSRAIIVDQVWKKFERGERHDSLRDLIPAAIRRLVGVEGARPMELGRQEFWALKDVSFEVGPGQALGIIGHNGAGKSTLLKLLTRILKPTRGRCEVRGRVGSLIEIAAGFHQDLTGRENVFLQGAIMGMRRAEIARKFEEIVAFAEMADFIDTPVKRYSSGMQARLGFAVAAHLDAEVLIIDEVLSVGDAAFQDRAMERMRTLMRKEDVPVVVVSHQLERVAALCSQAVLLDHGRVAYSGRPSDCISAYLLGHAGPECRAGSSVVSIDTVTAPDTLSVRSGECIAFTITGAISGDIADIEPVCVVVRSHSTREVVFASSTTRLELHLDRGPFRLWVELRMNLPAGLYIIETSTWNRKLGQTIGSGPTLLVQVEEGPSFWGTAQLSPRMRLHRDAGCEHGIAPPSSDTRTTTPLPAASLAAEARVVVASRITW